MGRANYYALFRILDATLLTTVLILQSVILSQYTIYSQFKEVVPSNVLNPIYQKVIWLAGDFVSLALLLLACLCGFKNLLRGGFLKHLRFHHPPQRTPQHQPRSHNLNPFEDSISPPPPSPSPSLNEEHDDKKTCFKYFTSPKIPLCYSSWFIYSTLLSAKIALIFAWNINEKWRDSQQNNLLFGPHMFQFGICLSSVIFSLLVEAHHNAGIKDLQRNAYLNSVAYEVALEILDTACLLSYLIPSFDYGEGHDLSKPPSAVEQPSEQLTLPIILLSAINLILPSVTLYKLTSTNFGETYHVKLELIYKTLHLLLVDIPFLVIRIHVWNRYDREDVIFMLKNVYGIFWFFRGVYSDVQALREETKAEAVVKQEHEREWQMSSKRGRMTSPNISHTGHRNSGIEKGMDSVEMKRFMSHQRRD